MMKKKRIAALLLALCMPVSALASGAQTDVTANAVAESRNIYKLTAPCSGVLMPFSWKTGEEVTAEDWIFALDTIKVYAPVDGTVRAVFAEPGQLAADVMSEYGMLVSIEKDCSMMITASTSGAYNDPENRRVHAGETLYVEQSSDRDNKGAGRVIAVNGKDYTMELTKGDFEDSDSVKLYRDDTMSSKSCVGSGNIGYMADVAVDGSGRVVAAHAREGQHVKQGDLLLELLGQDAASDVTSQSVEAGADGVLELLVTPGAQVYKGQVLARIHTLDQMRVVASVDEMDLDAVKVGETVNIAFDRYPDELVVGTVSRIGGLGVTRQNAAYYDVEIDFYTTLEILPGMNATVYLNK